MEKTMLKVRRERIDENTQARTLTWGLVPLSEECPYLFAAYEPSTEVLRIDSKHKRLYTEVFYQQDEAGNVRKNKNGLPLQPYVESDERYFFFVLENPIDIKNFIDAICINADEKMEVVIIPATPPDQTVPEPVTEEVIEAVITKENL